MNTVLRQVADPAAPWFGNPSRIRLDHARDALHESGFACSVGTREGDSILITQHEGEPVKQDAGSDLDAELLNGQHGAEVAEMQALGKDFA